MTAPVGLEERLLSFRRAFDQAFAVAPTATVEVYEDLLAVRVAGDPYALRVREITGLVASRKIVSLPSRRPELLGVAGIRGSLVAVYSLAALLGYGVESKPPAWLALPADEPIGLGFEEFEGFFRVRSRDVQAGEVVVMANQSRRVVDIPSTLAALDVHAGAAGPPKES